MIREDLRDVDVLRGVDEEAPPEDVEEDEENGGAESGCVGRVQVLGREGAEEDDADETAG